MTQNNSRIEVIDALRGFAILAIMLLHFSNHFLYGHHPESTSEFGNLINSNTKNLLYFLFEGKAFAIFALLFGFTFGLQYYKATEKGIEFRFRFLWRMLGLVAFGYLNAAFFPGGDPLVFMAIVAIILPPIAKLNTKTLLGLAVFFLIQPLEIYQIANILLNPEYNLPKKLTNQLYPLLTPAVESGNLLEMLWINSTTGLKACLSWAYEFGRLSQTAGLYILGFLCYKHKLFEKRSIEFWFKTCIIALTMASILFVFKESFDSISKPLKTPLSILATMVYNLFASFILISTFIILYQADIIKKLAIPFQYYGKMSLTNFVAQSLIGSFIFFPYGLNLAESTSLIMSVFIALIVAILQIVFSKWWLNKYRRGPLEYLWHRFTYLF